FHRGASMLGAFAFSVGCGEGASTLTSRHEALEEPAALAAAGPRSWFRTQTLLAEPQTDEAFGSLIATDGTTAIVGKLRQSFFAYVESNGEWGEPEELISANADP